MGTFNSIQMLQVQSLIYHVLCNVNGIFGTTIIDYKKLPATILVQFNMFQIRLEKLDVKVLFKLAYIFVKIFFHQNTASAVVHFHSKFVSIVKGQTFKHFILLYYLFYSSVVISLLVLHLGTVLMQVCPHIFCLLLFTFRWREILYIFCKRSCFQ